MCGIVGIVANQPVNQLLYDALTVLQHRGQDAAGIVTCGHHGRFYLRKDMGLVRDVFREKHMLKLVGSMGLGHVRYPTAGSDSTAEAQPFYVNSPYGITLAHNGNLTNADELKEQLFVEDQRHLNTNSDSEVLLNVFAHELAETGKLRLTPEDVFKGVAGVYRRCQGGFAVVAMIAGFGVLAFRDPYGIRPLCFGQRQSAEGTEYMIASESVALDNEGFELVRDVQPGEAIFIEKNGRFHNKQCIQDKHLHSCIFEYVYLARPDSVIDGISVYNSRLRMGEKLAAKIRRLGYDKEIDVVVPIPDTSRTSAMQLAETLGIKYREGFIKNRYIGRTFIMPGQQLRKRSVRQKLNPIMHELKDKNVLLVDDSIVRGTTSGQIIQMAREAGSKKVFFASASPPVRFPNVYGIDMPSCSELVAHDRSEQQICDDLGADALIYQDIEDLIAAVGQGRVNDFDTACFDGHYVTGDINRQYLNLLEQRRNEAARTQRINQESSEDTEIGLYNSA
ncbi:MAG: amidophosphoribosyltransferase [Gammaproteobacteria bacterium]|nr:amidophosphoribosyltransferase [Gammaproteobacteria bacterium]